LELSNLSITYSVSSNTITVTGYTQAAPCTFNDLYNADVAGGWGKVARQGTNQFLFNCKLVIGDGSVTTFFSDSLKQVVFADGLFSANTQRLIDVRNNATLTLGVLADAATKRTRDGVTVFSLESTYYGHMIYPQSDSALVYLYGCSFFGVSAESWWQAIAAYNINCNGRSYPHISQYTSDVPQDYNNIIVSGEGTTGSGYGIRRPNSATMLNNLFISAPSTKVWFQSASGTAKNLYFRGPGYTARMDSVTAGNHCYIINADDAGAAWSISWAASPNANLYRQYELDLTVSETAENGDDLLEEVTVTLKDKNNNTVFTQTTNAAGAIATQTVTHGYFDQTHGSTEQQSGPFTLYLTKPGYTPQSIPLPLNEKTKLTTSLKKQHTNVFFGINL
jgi:hypothetical protein